MHLWGKILKIANHKYPIKNLSSWQRREWLEIVDYGRSCLEMQMKQINWELAIIDYPRIFYIGKCNFKQQWPSLAFTSVPLMVMKIIGVPTVSDDSQLLADYHWHFHTYQMIITVYAIDYFFNFNNKLTHTHAEDNLQYNISTEWNILKCAHDFLKCMLCLVYPTIILELKYTIFLEHLATKNNFISARFVLIKPIN